MLARVTSAGSLVLGLACTVWAGPVTLQASSLLTTPGVIAVDQQNVTAVQFCETLGWLAYKAPWLHAQISQQDRRVLLLDISAASGQASMSVWVEGQGAPLQLSVRASGTVLPNHLYFVSCGGQPQKPVAQAHGPRPNVVQNPPSGSAIPNDPPKPAVTAPTVAPTDASGPAWDAFVSGLSPHQWDLLKALITSPTKDSYAAFTTSLTPEQTKTWTSLYAPPR
jgi:hypothetical protein